MKAQKAKKLQNGAGHGAAKSIVRTLGKRAIFGNLWGGAQKLTPKRPKCKEMKAQGLGFRVFSGFAGSGIGWWNVFYRGNEVKRNLLQAAPYGAAAGRWSLGRSSRGPSFFSLPRAVDEAAQPPKSTPFRV